MYLSKTIKSFARGGVPPQSRRGIARHFQNKFVDAIEVITNGLPIS